MFTAHVISIMVKRSNIKRTKYNIYSLNMIKWVWSGSSIDMLISANLETSHVVNVVGISWVVPLHSNWYCSDHKHRHFFVGNTVPLSSNYWRTSSTNTLMWFFQWNKNQQFWEQTCKKCRFFSGVAIDLLWVGRPLPSKRGSWCNNRLRWRKNWEGGEKHG